MKKTLVVALYMGDEADSRYIKVTINNSLEQIAALIQSARNVPFIRFYDNAEESCLFETTKKGFIVYQDTWNIFAPDIAEMIFKPYRSIKILNFSIPEEDSCLKTVDEVIKKHQMPIDTSKWELDLDECS